MPADFWDAFERLRDADPCKQDPLFDPHLVRLLAPLRPDTCILTAVEAGEPVGFWPIHKRPGGWARPLGGPFSDWHAPIRKLGVEIAPHEFLKQCSLSGLTMHGFQPCANGPVSDGCERMAANMTDLSHGFEAYLEEQRKQFPKHFKKMRRMQRNAERDFSEVTYSIDDQDPAAFEWLLEKKRTQYVRTGRHDVLASDWSQGYLDALRHGATDTFGLKLCTMRFDGKLAAAELNMASSRVLHGWLTGFEAEYAYYSPGYMLQHAILELMEPEGLVVYDAGPELDYYKKYYANFVLPIDRGVMRSSASSASPARLFGSGWRAAEDSMPEKIGNLMGKTRRRMDQILLSETKFSRRAGGVMAALKGAAD
jgi:CelD/BcsL family acetyltransferase involved in cellulose biosynthesis